MDNAQILTTLLADQYELYKGPVIPPTLFLKQHLPAYIVQLLQHFWSLNLAICEAGSAASYATGVTQHFQDIDVFLTTDVLKYKPTTFKGYPNYKYLFSRLSICLTHHNYQSDQVSFSLYPQNGFTGSSWKKLQLEDTTVFTLKTYKLRCRFFSGSY